jgi:hypothetical protein
MLRGTSNIPVYSAKIITQRPRLLLNAHFVNNATGVGILGTQVRYYTIIGNLAISQDVREVLEDYRYHIQALVRVALLITYLNNINAAIN